MAIETPAGDAIELSSGFQISSYIGLLGACFFSAGMTASLWNPLRPTPQDRSRLCCSAALFGVGLLLIAFGNTQPLIAFRTLASMEVIDANTIMAITGLGYIPLLIGYGIVLAGAAVAAWTGQTPAPSKAATGEAPRRLFARSIIVGSSFLVCLAALWTTSSVASFGAALSGDAPVGPAEVAGAVAGVLLSIYLSLFGLFGFGLACLLSSIERARDYNGELATQPKPSC